MKVCVDCQAAWSQGAGIGRAVRGLAVHLPKARGADEIVLFSFEDERFLARARAPQPFERVVSFPPGRVMRRAWRHLGAPPFDRLAGAADVYHFTNFARPPLSRGRSVVTIYDVSFLRLPETVEPRNLAYLRSEMPRTVERADVLLTISRFAAATIAADLGVPAERIITVPPGLDEIFAPPDPAQVDALRARLGLEKPYALFVGTLEPRKNIPFLVDVFEALDSLDLDLAVAGSPGWKHEPILARLRSTRRARSIRLLGPVGDEALPALYAGAEVFLFPSRDEGFGLPPLEAMACGAPVVSSTEGALPETLGDAACQVSAFEPDAWAHAVRSLLEDSRERARRVARGREQARRYSWQEAAARTWDVYRALAS